jgi:hypothetical protein
VLAMGMRLRHRDLVVPSTAAVPAARETRGSSIGRTLRTAWWPRFLVAGVVLVVVGVTLLSGTAQALASFGGAVIFVLAAAVGLLGKSWDRDRRREPPVPPGIPGPHGM